MNGYTYGMTAFGKDEIEVVESAAAPAELTNFSLILPATCFTTMSCYRMGRQSALRKMRSFRLQNRKVRAVEGEPEDRLHACAVNRGSPIAGLNC